MTLRVSIVVAVHYPSLGIGFQGQLPWKIPEDMALFQQVTSKTPSANMQNAVIMGRKTWDSIPAKFRPLKNRLNVVITSSVAATYPEGVLVASSLPDALGKIESMQSSDQRTGEVFVIGGASLFNEAMKSSACQKIYLTEVYGGQFASFDTYFSVIPANEYLMTQRGKLQQSSGTSFRFCQFDRVVLTTDEEKSWTSNPEEAQYLQIVSDIMNNGVLRGDRTGTGTLSKFGLQMRFSLRNNSLPLITTKKVFWRGVAEELLWFVKGSTDAKLLIAKDIHIWDGNASREFLDSRGLHEREEGDLGPVYGFQWRHFGAEYTHCHADYSSQGIDQLKQCIELIRKNPADRRIVLTAWNPKDLDKMALPPCHMFCQFYVANNELSCQMYQRSADMGLGVPFNIASYALLTHMVASVCGLSAGELVHVIGDAHVYCNHVDALREQIIRKPNAFPKLIIKRPTENIDEFVFEDFEVIGYEPQAAIKMRMAV